MTLFTAKFLLNMIFNTLIRKKGSMEQVIEPLNEVKWVCEVWV